MSVNSHYVPQFILRHYGEHLCIYDVKAGKYEKGRNPDSLFCKQGLYPEDIEKSFANKIEQPFSRLMASKLLAEQKDIVLSWDEVMLIKKFFLLSTIRTEDSLGELAKERSFYDDMQTFLIGLGLSKEEAKASEISVPFVEVGTKDLSDKEYCFRTLRCILDAKDINPETIAKTPNATYAAYRWSYVMYIGFVAFWDASPYKDEFVISDVGMTSELETGCDGEAVHDHKKLLFIIKTLSKYGPLNKDLANYLTFQSINQTYFHENFMMFPSSAKRMIVFINPFFKFRLETKKIGIDVPSLSSFTNIPNENLFSANDVEYKKPQLGTIPEHSIGDKYVYHPHKLSGYETRYCNSLFLDAVYNRPLMK
jgi:hypothetical protein